MVRSSKYNLKEQDFYHTPAWRKARRLTLQRDHYLCQHCLRNKKITKATEVHHSKPIDTHPELALELNNLVSLCWRCHEATKPRKPADKLIDKLPVRIIKIK